MKNKRLYLSLFAAITLFVSCNNDDEEFFDKEETKSESKYIITATPTASEGVADYILTTDNLSQGSISIVGNGIEQDGTYRYYETTNNKFFSMLYGQGSPGAVTTYQLNENGSLDKMSDFQSETVHAFASVDNDILLIKISKSSDSPIANWYRLDTETSQFVAEGEINTQQLADKENGELAFFTWITQVEDKVYLPYFTLKAASPDKYGTEYPDEANIAVYSYPEMEYIKTITDDRTSYVGRYYTNGLTLDEKGDAYAFSSSVGTNNGVVTSTKPSAISRIKNGTTEFDNTFLYNIEDASGGKYATTHIYLGNGKFLVYLEDIINKGAFNTGKEFAIIDVYTESFTMITGIPSPEDIIYVTERNNYISEDGSVAYIGITTEAGSFIYNVDVASANATQGLEVEGGVITAISKLDLAD